MLNSSGHISVCWILADECPFAKRLCLARKGGVFVDLPQGVELPVFGAGVVEAAPRRERSDAAESRRRVLDAARGLFAERSVDAVSMHEIGRAAGVGQGTLYRRYEHKGALCSALLAEEIEGFVDEVRRRAGGRGSALGRLKWFLGRLARFNDDNAALLGAIRDAAGGGRRVEMYGNPFYSWLRGTVAALVRQAMNEGAMMGELDVECVADALLATLNIDLYLYQRHELGMSRERVTRSLHALLDGLRPGPAS